MSHLVSRGHDPTSFRHGVRSAVSWLHDRAKEMNDPRAEAILNVAAWDLGNARLRHGVPPASEAATTIETQAAEIERLRASLAEALDLLMPFAEAADDLDDAHPDHTNIWEAPAAGGIDAIDLRAARDFITKHGGETPHDPR